MTWPPQPTPPGTPPSPSTRAPGAHPATAASLATAYPSGYQPDPGRRAGGRSVLRTWLLTGVVVGGFLAIAVVISRYYDAAFGLTTTLLGLLAALVPLGIVVPAFLWLDRLEAEPVRYLLFAFFWGALVAAAVAATLNTSAVLVLRATVNQQDAMSTTAVLVAPVVEEAAKGLAVLLILLGRRREFDGISDGMVYAGLAAAGFAFTENIQYLATAYTQGGGGALAVTFVMRCLMSPFAHPMFTVLTGVGLGVAATTRHWPLRLGAPVFGYLLAVLAHSLWNLAAVAGANGLLLIYLLVEVPIFLGFVALMFWARAHEGRLIGRHLTPYAAAGWLAPHEVGMLASARRRREAQVWARTNGGRPALRSMRRMQDAASELALLRRRMEHGTAGSDAQQVERALLDTLMTRRGELTRVGAPPVAAHR